MKTLLLSVAVAVGLAGLVSVKPAQADEPFIGEITYFGGNFAPRGWAFCNGQLLPIAQYSALFSILGTTYGGDGRTTFGLPNMQSRAPVGPGTGPGLSTFVLGQRTGAEQVTLNITELGNHTHSGALKGVTADGTETSPSGTALAGSQATMYQGRGANTSESMYAGSATASLSGGGQPHENRPPYLAVNCIIALQGIYPSRS